MPIQCNVFNKSNQNPIQKHLEKVWIKFYVYRQIETFGIIFTNMAPCCPRSIKIMHIHTTYCINKLRLVVLVVKTLYIPVMTEISLWCPFLFCPTINSDGGTLYNDSVHPDPRKHCTICQKCYVRICMKFWFVAPIKYVQSHCSSSSKKLQYLLKE